MVWCSALRSSRFSWTRSRVCPSALVYTVVALLVFGEAALFIGFVLPGETSVIVAGVVASQGRVNIVALCVLVVVAAIIGDSVGYAVGRRFGVRLLEMPMLQRRRDDVDRALEGLRTTRSVLRLHRSLHRVLARGDAGTRGDEQDAVSPVPRRQRRRARLIWGVAITLLGYFAGTALTKIERYASWFGLSLLALLIAFFVGFHFYRKRREAARRR